MAITGLQIGGFMLGLIGVTAVIGATMMNNWSTKDRQGDVVTSVYTYKGLWQDCEVSTSGFTECRPLYGLLGYSGICAITGASIYANQIVSSFMMSAYNPNYGGMNQMQMEGTGMGGIGMPMATTYTFGPALFMAWVGGGLLIIGGILKSVAFKSMHMKSTPYKAVVYKVPSQSRSADDESERG